MSTANVLPLPSAQIPIAPSPINLTDKTICLSLTMGALGNNKKVSTSEVTVDADADWIRVSKTLLDAKELKAILKHRRDVKEALMNIALPSLFRTGIYLVPTAAVQKIQTMLLDAQAKDVDLVEALAQAYEQRKVEAQDRLKGLYNPQDYPPVARVRNSFVLEWQWVAFSTPSKLKEISAEFFREEQQKAADKWRQATDEITLLLRAQFKELVDHMVERLEPDAEGKPKKFQTTTFDKVKEFLENFQIRNVTDDAELDGLVRATEKLLSNNPDSQSIRNDDHLRGMLTQGFGIIKQHLDPLVEEAGSRKIVFGDE